MDIQEIKKLHTKLDQDLYKLLTEFEKQTGTTIADILFTRVTTTFTGIRNGSESTIIVDTKVEI